MRNFGLDITQNCGLNTTRNTTRNIALDIGNTRCKIAFGEEPGEISVGAHGRAGFEAWLDATLAGTPAHARWWVASVNRPACECVSAWVAERRGGDTFTVLEAADIPIQTRVAHPERVGVDRLLAAVGANEIRTPGRPAVVMDLGTAVKVDALDPGGVFLGGAIAPGLRMNAIALERQTDALPELDVEPILAGLVDGDISSIGANTLDALRAGIFWGMVGTLRELAAQTAQRLGGEPDLFLTGGGARTIQRALGDRFRYVDELVMRGLWTTIRARERGHSRSGGGA